MTAGLWKLLIPYKQKQSQNPKNMFKFFQFEFYYPKEQETAERRSRGRHFDKVEESQRKYTIMKS